MARGPLRDSDPRKVGPYQLEQRLGSGGMGQVFLGRSRGGRLVAVKVVRPDLADEPKFRRRFAREVKAASKVGGFYTAEVVEADPEADPPWLATAFIPGPTLAEVVEEHGPLPADTLRELGAGLAEGLAEIHARELVHRDLKPGNVIIAADGPRVIDFGIAHAVDASSTTTMKVVGTPAFMSPEQAQAEEVGPASDVFSLGSVLTFAATGHGPFDADKIPAILYRIVHHEPDLTGLPKELVDLVSTCLSKDPAARPGVEEILDRLAKPVQITTRWQLPPAITTMIKERENGTQLLTTEKPAQAEPLHEHVSDSTSSTGSLRNIKASTVDGPAAPSTARAHPAHSAPPGQPETQKPPAKRVIEKKGEGGGPSTKRDHSGALSFLTAIALIAIISGIILYRVNVKNAANAAYAKLPSPCNIPYQSVFSPSQSVTVRSRDPHLCEWIIKPTNGSTATLTADVAFTKDKEMYGSMPATVSGVKTGGPRQSFDDYSCVIVWLTSWGKTQVVIRIDQKVGSGLCALTHRLANVVGNVLSTSS